MSVQGGVNRNCLSGVQTHVGFGSLVFVVPAMIVMLQVPQGDRRARPNHQMEKFSALAQ